MDMQFISLPAVGAFGALIPNEFNLRCESIELLSQICLT